MENNLIEQYKHFNSGLYIKDKIQEVYYKFIIFTFAHGVRLFAGTILMFRMTYVPRLDARYGIANARTRVTLDIWPLLM